MARSAADQEKEIRDIVRRAEKTTLERTAPFRRDTLKKLIDLTHSPHPTLKVFAAGSIKLFFKDFPDLEEDAINAVYDLCEDQAQEVRIAGYFAIVQVSKEQKKWVKRNADVLVQLLQSDEPHELARIKRALQEHLDMDAPVTLSVLCDQVLQPDESMDEEEQQMRDRSRSLVIAFLTGDIKSHIVERHAKPGTNAEQVLVSQLLLAIPKLSDIDTQNIVNNLLIPLPSYTHTSQRGNELLKVLLEKAEVSLRDDTLADRPSLKRTRPTLELASSLSTTKRLASPTELLHFYTQSSGTLDLAKLSEDDYIYFVEQTAQALAAAEEENRTKPDAQLAGLRDRVITFVPTALNLLAYSTPLSATSWKACETFLEACTRKQKDSGWVMPPKLAASLTRIQKIEEQTVKDPQAKAIFENIQKLIRSLVPSSSKPNAPPRTASPQVSASSQTQPGDTRSRSISNQVRPITVDNTLSGRTNSSAGGLAIRGAGPSAISHKRDMSMDDDSPRSHKKPRQSNGPGPADPTPSLLSRLGSTNGPAGPRPPTAPATSRADNKNPPARVPRQGQTDLDAPSGGWSILGAASRSQPSSPKPISRASSASLLDRMKGVDIEPGNHDRGSVRKRKRGGQR